MAFEYNKSGSNAMPDINSFSINKMDHSKNPINDFYHYANGQWLTKTEIPDDKSSWGSFVELSERNLYLLKDITENCQREIGKDNSENVKKIWNFYSSVMNTALLEDLKIKPLESYLRNIKKIKSREELYQVLISLEESGITGFFSIEASQDKKNSSIYALYLEQGGLSLPNRDYYLEDSYKNILNEFEKFANKMFKLTNLHEYGEDSVKAILKFESELAKVSRSNEELRDEEKNYNRFDRSNLNSLFSYFDLNDFISKLGVPEVSYVVVGQPEFFSSLNEIINRTGMETLKAYLSLRVIISASPLLNEEIEDANFDFFGKKLMGMKVKEERWKKAVKLVSACMGEALGEIYVKKYFPEESKRLMEEMVEDIKSVFREKLTNVEWMSQKTREKALEKFATFRTKIGYPTKFLDYSSLKIKPDDLIGNVQRSSVFEIKRRLKRVGKEVDREEWEMSPQTVNAYFSPTDNEIVFPAAILQPPFFDPNMDKAVNYGAIGGVISHEITHGYDDQGSMYDASGNVNNWWSEADKNEFNKRARKVSDLYSSMEVLPGVFVHGERTNGENIADFGGVSIAYAALERHLKNHSEESKKLIDGLTPHQRFFISWAQIWGEKIRPEYLKLLVTVDPHSPAELRATLPVYNHKGFYEAFQTPGGVKEDKIKRDLISIW